MTTRIVELRQGILKKNDELARSLRQSFTAAGVLVLNLVSSPGTGKTAFLERTLRDLRARGSRVAALVGDLETDNDARRLAASGAPVRQINTHGICHLDAEMIERHLAGWEGVALAGLDYLFIENVGNLVCPSSYDLGEKIRVALLSVTEGEDKPLKYPTLFNSADAAVITKMDIAEPCGFDRELALKNINEIRPGIRIFETSSKTGAGLEEWLGWLGNSGRHGRYAAAAEFANNLSRLRIGLRSAVLFERDREGQHANPAVRLHKAWRQRRAARAHFKHPRLEKLVARGDVRFRNLLLLFGTVRRCNAKWHIAVIENRYTGIGSW
jgi:hydrogenase nickel incorporation protein HypB